MNINTASISSIDEKQDLHVEPTVVQKKVGRSSLTEHLEIKRGVTPRYTSERLTQERDYGHLVKPMEPNSTTESDVNEPGHSKMSDFLSNPTGPSKQDENKMHDSPTPAPAAKVKIEASSDSESSPHRPTKRPKPKISSSSDEDNEADSKSRITGISSGGTRRGAAPRQPIKRGGKRF